MTFTNGWEGPKVYASQLGPQEVRADWAMPAPVTGIVPLRPLGVGDILGGAFRAVRYAPSVMLGLTFVALLVVQVVAVAVAFASGDALSTILLPFGLPGNDYGDTSLRSSLGFFANELAIIVAGMGLIYTVVEAVAGRRTSPAAALRHIGRRLGAALALTVLIAIVLVAVMALVGALIDAVGLPVILLLVFFGLPAALALNVKLLFVPCAVSVEQMGPLRAVARSWRLTGGVFWRTLGTYLLTLVIMWIPTATISGVVITLTAWFFMGDVNLSTGSPAALAVTAAGSILSLVLTVPLVTAVQTLLYVDARIRREGYDIVLGEEIYG